MLRYDVILTGAPWRQVANNVCYAGRLYTWVLVIFLLSAQKLIHLVTNVLQWTRKVVKFWWHPIGLIWCWFRPDTTPPCQKYRLATRQMLWGRVHKLISGTWGWHCTVCAPIWNRLLICTRAILERVPSFFAPGPISSPERIGQFAPWNFRSLNMYRISPRSRRRQAAAASHIHTDSSQSYLQWRRWL